MKTAISIPDDLFEQATRWAHALGLSRSAFFAHAAERYVDELSRDSLTEQINEALAHIGDDDSWRDAAEQGRYMLSKDAEDW